MPPITNAASRVEIVGEFSMIRRTFPNDDGTVTIVATAIVEGEGQTIRGTVEQEDDLTPGLSYRFAGRWDDHPRWGRQFAFTSYTVDAPHGRAGVLKYLEKFATHVGKKTAERLWEKYGGDAAAVLADTPERVAEDGLLTLGEALEAAESLQTIAAHRDTIIDLMELFSGRGFPSQTVQACLKRWGVRSPAMIRKNPFALMLNKIPGAGFRRCDTLYQELGMPLDKLKRQMLCGWYWVNSDTSGHTWHRVETVAQAIREAIGGAARPKPAIVMGLRSKWLRKRRDEAGQLWIAAAGKASAEQVVAERVRDLLTQPPRWAGVPQAQLSDHQYAAVCDLLTHPLALLMGSPGTGKTFTAAAVIRAQGAIHGYSRIRAAAPTGKAATRLSANLKGAGIPVEVSTIHRLLEASPGGPDGFSFKRNAENPIEATVIVIDEVSMLDTQLAASLFSAIRPGTMVLLVGDRNQLPPVQHGAPLRDFVTAGLPQAELTEIRRNSGAIVETCAQMKDGRRFDAAPLSDSTPEKNLVLVEARTDQERFDAVAGLMDRFKLQPEIDPLMDVQVLTATNATRKQLNRLLQDQLNPPQGGNARKKFRRGDKVIALSNGFRNAAQGSDKVFVSNGDIGVIEATADRSITVRFLAPTRMVRFPLGRQPAAGQEEGEEEGNGGTGDIDLAYAVTGHKYQGSECPYVIVVLEPAGWRVAAREWHYTAISRAKWLCILVGQMATLEQQVQRVSLPERKTFLVELLREGLPRA